MNQLWFYGQTGNKLGPFSAQQLRDLALAGKILVTDTVWKDGIEKGVLRDRVKNLFPVPPGIAVPAVVAASQVAADPAAALAPVTSTEEPSAPPAPVDKPAVEQPANKAAVAQAAKKLRALVLRGARIMGQDGAFMQFVKVCTTCKHEDTARTSMRIRTGKMKFNFFCRKCRKGRDVEIQGQNQ
jgi:hypothetical protein